MILIYIPILLFYVHCMDQENHPHVYLSMQF